AGEDDGPSQSHNGYQCMLSARWFGMSDSAKARHHGASYAPGPAIGSPGAEDSIAAEYSRNDSWYDSGVQVSSRTASCGWFGWKKPFGSLPIATARSRSPKASWA